MPHGTPIWYELVSRDADAARTFYQAVIGWRIEDRSAGEMDYRMNSAATASSSPATQRG